MQKVTDSRAPRTRLRSAAIVLGALTLVVSVACTRNRPPATTTTTATTRPPATGGIRGPSGKTLDTVNYVQEANEARAAGQTPWFCQAQGEGGSHGHSGGPAHNAYVGKVKGTVSWQDCLATAQMFDRIITLVKPFKTRGDAKRAGSSQLVQFVKGLGTHDTVRSPQLTTRPGLPPGPPMFLQYDGEGDNAPLAGLSYFAISGAAPPAGFPGDNDFWHTHATLCYTRLGNVNGNEISAAECQARGGFNLPLPGVWMSHAWIIPGWEKVRDVYSGAYMCLKGTGVPPAANDPCRDDTTDPEHPTSTTTTRPGTPTTARPGPTTPTTMPPMDHGSHGH
jgi:hypothetical protein